MILNRPISAVLAACVPPQSSRENGWSSAPTETTRTTSPYFSPNRATAPAALASSMPMTRVTTGLEAKICWLTRSSTALSCSEDRASKCVKSKRRCSGVTSEPAWETCSPRTCLRAASSRCVAVWLRRRKPRRSASSAAVTAAPTASVPSATCATWAYRPLWFLVSATVRTTPSAESSPASPCWPPISA